MSDFAFYVVDRIESGIAVVANDTQAVSHEVPLTRLPPGTREDTVLRVPLVAGQPAWDRAVIDAAERERRIAAVRKALEELGRQDPGGDIRI